MSTYQDAQSHLQRYVASHPTLTAVQINAAQQVHSQLQRLAELHERLMRHNQALTERAENHMRPRIYIKDGKFLAQVGDEPPIVLGDAGPNASVQACGVAGAFVAGADHDILDEPTKQLHADLAADLESYYYTAHRIMKTMEDPLGLRFNCRPVTIVRNKLMEHPPHESYSPYSFGWGPNGPFAKPTRIETNPAPDPALVFHDEGLLPNALDFCNAFVRKLESA